MTLAVTEGVWIAIIGLAGTLGAAAIAAAGTICVKLLGDGIKHLAAISTNSAETKAEVASLKCTVSGGLDTQTREIGKVVLSVDKLTEAVDEHSKILKDHDARISQVESGR
ncbi:MAG: hypothetical protein KDB18_11650 [Salinibacterium sp.]|nr:hypothetical protein [Salinibacterium sp.]